jgi:ribonucleotide monophosphatase NagD (HAD superfamily)
MKRKIPAIVSDLEGVLVNGRHAIPSADTFLENITQKRFIFHDD